MAAAMKFLLGLGVSGGVGVGIILGGYKLRQQLQIRNKPQSYFTDGEVNEIEDMSNMTDASCPMSANFERLFTTPTESGQHVMFKDVGGRIAH